MPDHDQPVKRRRGERSIATFDSTSISVHWSLVAALLVVGLLVRFWFLRRYSELGQAAAAGATVAVLGVIAASLVGRELVQTQVAKHHGLSIPTLSLSAIGARIRASSPPPYPRAEFQISGSGFLFTATAAITLFLLASLSDYYRLNTGLDETLTMLALMNLVLAVVNLVPMAPLDSGRMLTAILWHRRGSRSAGQIVSGKVALWSGCCLGLVGLAVSYFDFLSGIVVLCVATLVAVVGRIQTRKATVRRRLETTTVADIAIRRPLALPDSLTVARLVAWALGDQAGVAYPVTRWDSDPIGYIVPTFAYALSEPERSWTKVDQVMRSKRDVDRCWSGETIDEVLRRIPLSKSTIVVVHDPTTMHEIGTVAYTQIQGLLVPPDFWGRFGLRFRSPVPQTSMS